jgi:hypothetical protein
MSLKERLHAVGNIEVQFGLGDTAPAGASGGAQPSQLLGQIL